VLSAPLRLCVLAYAVGAAVMLSACARRNVGVEDGAGSTADPSDWNAHGGDSGSPDMCLNDPSKTAEGACGCGAADTDSDGDQTPDCEDDCKDDPNKTSPGLCGCGMPEGSCDSISACATADEGGTASLSCPSGRTIHSIEFASYGTPLGSCEAGFSKSACDASYSLEKVRNACVGKQTCSVVASPALFDDPCIGTLKRLAVNYTCGVGAVEVMSVYLMAGQSNMTGSVDGTLFDALLNELSSGEASTTQTRLKNRLADWYLNHDGGYASYGYSDAMATFESSELIRLKKAGLVGGFLKTPLASVTCALNHPDVAQLTTNCGAIFGPELVLGRYLHASGDTPTSLIKVTKGASTLYTEWRGPTTVAQSGGTVGLLYTQLQNRIDSLASRPEGVHASCASMPCRFGGFIWFQGENDSLDQAAASAYATNLRNLLVDVRGRVGASTMPVVVVEMGKWAQSLDYGASVRLAQRSVVTADANTRLVKTDDLSGFYLYDPAAQLIIGERVGIALSSMLP
jgi:hypothetical protein